MLSSLEANAHFIGLTVSRLRNELPQEIVIWRTTLRENRAAQNALYLSPFVDAVDMALRKIQNDDAVQITRYIVSAPETVQQVLQLVDRLNLKTVLREISDLLIRIGESESLFVEDAEARKMTNIQGFANYLKTEINIALKCIIWIEQAEIAPRELRLRLLHKLEECDRKMPNRPYTIEVIAEQLGLLNLVQVTREIDHLIAKQHIQQDHEGYQGRSRKVRITYLGREAIEQEDAQVVSGIKDAPSTTVAIVNAGVIIYATQQFNAAWTKAFGLKVGPLDGGMDVTSRLYRPVTSLGDLESNIGALMDLAAGSGLKQRILDLVSKRLSEERSLKHMERILCERTSLTGEEVRNLMAPFHVIKDLRNENPPYHFGAEGGRRAYEAIGYVLPLHERDASACWGDMCSYFVKALNDITDVLNNKPRIS